MAEFGKPLYPDMWSHRYHDLCPPGPFVTRLRTTAGAPLGPRQEARGR